MTLFSDLVRCETRLYNHLDDRLRAQHGLVTSQFEFLLHVRDHDAPRVADLAARFAVGVGATSKGVDRLEARGWLAREPNPADRRSTVLVLTDAGRDVVAAAERTARDELATVLGAIADEDLAAVARALTALRGVLEDRGLGTPTG